MPRYAQINDDGLCVAVSDLRDEHDEANLILLGENENRMGQVWSGSAWSTPTPPVVYAVLTHLEFIELCETVGGTTDAMLVASKSDPLLAAFWIKFDMAQDLRHDDSRTAAGLAALNALGYLPNGAQAVLDAWPTL